MTRQTKNNWLNLFLIVFLIASAFMAGRHVRSKEYQRKSDWIDGLATEWMKFQAENKEGLANLERLTDETDALRYECDMWRKIAFENRSNSDTSFYIVYEDSANGVGPDKETETPGG